MFSLAYLDALQTLPFLLPHSLHLWHLVVQNPVHALLDVVMNDPLASLAKLDGNVEHANVLPLRNALALALSTLRLFGAQYHCACAAQQPIERRVRHEVRQMLAMGCGNQPDSALIHVCRGPRFRVPSLSRR